MEDIKNISRKMRGLDDNTLLDLDEDGQLYFSRINTPKEVASIRIHLYGL